MDGAGPQKDGGVIRGFAAQPWTSGEGRWAGDLVQLPIANDLIILPV